MRRLFHVFAVLVLTAPVRAQEPQFHYQGKLITTNGLPFSGSIDVVVNVHTQDTGGIAVYTEAVGTVPVQQGLYAFPWGEPGAAAPITRHRELWLEISIDAEPLSPRQRVATAPYAVSTLHFSGEQLGIGIPDPVETLEVNGAVALGGTKNPSPSAGTIRWTGQDFEGFDGTRWLSLTGTIPLVITNNMALVPGGAFQMGDTFSEGNVVELPVHTSETGAFYIDQYEVTYQLWNEVSAWATNNGYAFDNPGAGRGPDHPVHSVNWYDAVKWCNARSEKEELEPVYFLDAGFATLYRIGRETPEQTWVNWAADGYRLPTEAEWEKAVRGGTEGRRFPWAESLYIQHSRANYFSTNALPFDTSPTRGLHPDYAAGDPPHTSPAGSFAPNGFRLFDMVGNVAEWCWDWRQEDWYSRPEAFGPDPRGPNGPLLFRVHRGGSWSSENTGTRCAHRGGGQAANGYHDVGFRCVRRE